MNGLSNIINESQRWASLDDNPHGNILFASFSIGPRFVHAHEPQNLGCKLKATSRRGPFCGSRKSLRVASRVAPCRPLGRTAATEAPFLYKKPPHTRRSQWNEEVAKGGRGQRARKTKRVAAGKTKERAGERGRAKELRKRDGESREVEWGKDWGSEERRWMRKEERGNRREAGEIEEVHTRNVGGKESETGRTIEENWNGKKNEIKNEKKIKINWSSSYE